MGQALQLRILKDCINHCTGKQVGTVGMPTMKRGDKINNAANYLRAMASCKQKAATVMPRQI